MGLRRIGNIFIIISLIIFVFIYGPIAIEETKYLQRQVTGVDYLEEIIEPVSKEFGLMIPKIGINVKVFKNIDAFDPHEYRQALTKGVAHAKDSALPGRLGYTFLFAHSAESPFNIARYNAVFYLLKKLEEGDEIDIFYQGKEYQYQVIEEKIVSAQTALDYINKKSREKFLVLQTCHPPGTTLKRLVIIAQEKSSF